MKVDVANFSWLEDHGLEDGWTNLSKADLESALAMYMGMGITAEDNPSIYQSCELYGAFVDMIASAQTPGETSDGVLTVLCKDGVLEKVLGPAIFQDDNGGLVMKAGDSTYQVTLGKNEISVGGFTAFTETGSIDVKDDDGNDVKSVTASAEGEVGDGSIELNFILEDPKGLSKMTLKKAFSGGDAQSLAGMLKVAGAGGYGKMNDLEVGEYRLTALEENKPHPEYGRSWLMTLEGVGQVISKGKQFEARLAQKANIYETRLKSGQPVTLKVSAKNVLSQGIQVKAGLFFREPNPSLLVSGGAELKSAALPSTPQKELVAAGATVDVPAASSADIPF